MWPLLKLSTDVSLRHFLLVTVSISSCFRFCENCFVFFHNSSTCKHFLRKLYATCSNSKHDEHIKFGNPSSSVIYHKYTLYKHLKRQKLTYNYWITTHHYHCHDCFILNLFVYRFFKIIFCCT